jgi:RHS repeat-associated protein
LEQTPAGGRVVATIDATGVRTACTYGDREAAIRGVVYGMDSAGNSNPTAYHEVITDPEGRVTKYDFDDLGRVWRRVSEADQGLTQVDYNLLGSVQRVIDPTQKETVYTFDTLGRTKTIKPYYTAGVETLAYDQTGNVIRRTSQDGCALDQVYDVMGRLVSRSTSNWESCPRAPVNDAFAYDARGLLAVAKNDSVGLIREYDALGRLVREIDTRFGTGVGYAWDQASRLTSKVYPDGSVVHYAYDGAGRTVGISDPFGDTTRFVYDAAGRRLQRRGTSGIRTDYSYRAATGWLEKIASEGEPSSPFVMTMNYQSYDQVGNRLSANDFGGPIAYTYDALDRLESVDPGNQPYYPANGAKTWFAYDAGGNRTDFGPRESPTGGAFVSPHRTYTYSPGLKRLQNIQEDGATLETFTYDANGNAVGWTSNQTFPRTLGYDALGRMVSIGWSFDASYVYDPFGRRIEKTEAGVTTRYQYDGLDVVAEYDAGGLAATYVFGPGIDEVLKLKRGTTVAAYHSDGLGSVLALSTPGFYRNRYVYSAFGELVNATSSGGPPLANAYTYTGRELDASGLYYYRARYYLPSAGRFLTPDPLGLAGGTNAYAYVESNPVNYTDPFGLLSIAKTSLGPAAPTVGISLAGSDLFGGLLGGASGGYGFSGATESQGRFGVLDAVQTGLDVASIGLDATGIGAAVSWAPDLLNAGISLGRGDFTGAGLSAAAAVPLIGATANTARIARTADTFVYLGKRGGEAVYTGITNNPARRAAQHGDRFVLEPLHSQPVTRLEARSIEQALIVRNPGFENQINSISPRHPWYGEAVEWGEAWLRSHGF